MDILSFAVFAKKAQISNTRLSDELKNKALLNIAKRLDENKEAIFGANEADLLRGREDGLSSPLQKRLLFDENKLSQTIEGIVSLTKLPDPAGRVMSVTELDDDLILKKVTCPIGVIGVIFESRPDALVQISVLCLKSGNSVLLKGGSEALETNKVLAQIIHDAACEAGFSQGWLALLETRQDVSELLCMDEYIDLIIPRGSNEFVRYIIDNSRIPVLGHADGICHCYIDKAADIDKAVKIIKDSKLQYVAVCNALETLLVHKDIACHILPMVKEVFDAANVRIYGCERTKETIDVILADDDTYFTEYLDYAISVKIVDDLYEAMEHINRYGSGHTDVIVTEDNDAAEVFLEMIDSANVFHNCSTRFSDGFRYGLGAEVGISTNKIHARGPVGLEGLVIYKYKLTGDGHIVSDYVEGIKKFKHIRCGE